MEMALLEIVCNQNCRQGACVSVGGSVGCCSESQKATESRSDASAGCWAGQQRTRTLEDHTTPTLTVAGHALLTCVRALPWCCVAFFA